MMANKRANVTTAVGIVACILALPATPIASIGIPLILLARGYRALLDKQQDKNEIKENNLKMREEEINRIPSNFNSLPVPPINKKIGVTWGKFDFNGNTILNNKGLPAGHINEFNTIIDNNGLPVGHINEFNTIIKI
jgi:hypothetical protein